MRLKCYTLKGGLFVPTRGARKDCLEGRLSPIVCYKSTNQYGFSFDSLIFTLRTDGTMSKFRIGKQTHNARAIISAIYNYNQLSPTTNMHIRTYKHGPYNGIEVLLDAQQTCWGNLKDITDEQLNLMIDTINEKIKTN